MKPTHHQLDSPVWPSRAKGDIFIHIRVNRKMLAAALVSLLVHVLVLYIVSLLPKEISPVDAIRQPLEVSLALPQTQVKPLMPPEPKPKPEPKQLPKTKTLPPPATPPATPSPPPGLPKSAVPVTPSPSPTPTAPPSTPAPPMDMQSYVNANRERRRLAEEAAVREMGIAPPVGEERRSPPPSGTNGVFQILTLESRSATFSFHGWKNEMSFTRPVTYQVEVASGGDVRLEVIRKMIEIIRRYYSGDFNWTSHRLQRVVILSARASDNAGLEDFMMQEFFGQNGVAYGR